MQVIDQKTKFIIEDAEIVVELNRLPRLSIIVGTYKIVFSEKETEQIKKML